MFGYDDKKCSLPLTAVNFIFGFNRLNGWGATWLYVPWASVVHLLFGQVRLCFHMLLYPCCRAAGGKLVDMTPEVEKQLQQELDKVARQYGGGPGVDMTKFPTFTFQGNISCWVFCILICYVIFISLPILENHYLVLSFLLPLLFSFSFLSAGPNCLDRITVQSSRL